MVHIITMIVPKRYSDSEIKMYVNPESTHQQKLVWYMYFFTYVNYTILLLY